MKYIQALFGLIAIAAVGLELYYLLGVGSRTSNLQPLTSLLYLLFFWILWAYARVTDFVAQVFVLKESSVRWIVTVLLALSVSILLFVCLRSSAAQTSMMKFGILNFLIMVGYLLVAVVLFFGDRWLGPVVRLLKFGREFPKRVKNIQAS